MYSISCVKSAGCFCHSYIIPLHPHHQGKKSQARFSASRKQSSSQWEHFIEISRAFLLPFHGRKAEENIGPPNPPSMFHCSYSLAPASSCRGHI